MAVIQNAINRNRRGPHRGISCHSSPAADGDLVDGVVSVALVRPGCFGVGQSTQVNPDLGGVDHLLQGGRVVEVTVAGPEVWLGGQQAEDDAPSGERRTAGTQEK